MMEACCSRFTAAEGGARLAAAAATKNILAVEYASFIPVRLLYEKAYQIRGSLCKGSKRSIYITRASRVQVVAFEMKILTDLATVAAHAYDDVFDWTAELETKEVVICTSSVLKRILEEQILNIRNINVLIVDSCHMIYKDTDLKYIMQKYKLCPKPDQPTILALTYPLFTSTKKDIAKKDTTQEKTGVQQETEGEKDEERENIKVKEENDDINEIENLGDRKDIKREGEIDITEEEKTGNGEDIKKDGEKDNVTEIEKKKDEKVEEMGVYENLDDFNMYEKLEWKIEELESELCCQMDLAEDIDGGKRISASVTKPRELIIEYGSRPSDEELPELYKDLEKFMKDTVQEAMDFMDDHRHDPTEIYGDEMYDEFKNIPDPTIDPKQIFKQFLYVLEQLGPYAADKAAFSLLAKLEKLKIKIPYERHFLLMCLCTTVFIKIRCYADLLFSKYEDEWEKIKTFSSPKVMRFAEILEKFKPPDIRNNNTGISRRDTAISGQDTRDTSENKKDSTENDGLNIISRDDTLNRSDTTKRMLNDISKCDFTALGNKIQDRVNTYESNLKEIHEYPSISSKDTTNTISGPDSTDTPISESDTKNKTEKSPSATTNTVNKQDITNFTHVSGMDIRGNEIIVQSRGLLGFTRRSGHRLRGRTRLQRNNAARALQMQQNPDALCGIVYMKEALIAKIMFMMIVDMSRCNRRLGYICVQYCATETPADPGTEPRECQRQGKKQEEVLKKFRMHECNLLLATSALEEGIDLPRCNLVLRWDVPPSYRSYGLCRGRARAARSTAALLCSDNPDTTQLLLHNVATYRELDQVISRKCGCGIQDEPPQSEEEHADAFTHIVKPYTPSDSTNNNTCIESDYKVEATEENSQNHDTEASERVKVEDVTEDKSKYEIGKEFCDTTSKINDSVKDSFNKEMNEGGCEENGAKNNLTADICDGNVSINDSSNIRTNKNSLVDIDDTNKSNLENNGQPKMKHENNDNRQLNVDLEIVKTTDNATEEICIENDAESEAKSGIQDHITSGNKIVAETVSASNNNESNNTGCGNNDNSPVINEKNTDITLHNSETGELEVNQDKNTSKHKMENIEQNYHDNHDSKHPNKDFEELNLKERASEDSKHAKVNTNTDVFDTQRVNEDVISKEWCHNEKLNNVNSNKISKCDSRKCVSESDSGASVDLSSAIALINRYCGKLPSDTFTRLAPQWWMEEVQLQVSGSTETRPAYICTLRLPLNCPVKYNIVGHPMPTKVLARRMVALQACRILHKSGELDNQLMPIGKENFKAAELETTNAMGVYCASDATDPNDSARPGTTKRRQYYYKRTAWAFTDCQPVVDTSDTEINPEEQPQIESDFEEAEEKEPIQKEIKQKESRHKESAKHKECTGKKRNMLYAIVSKLWCALPERYNTRGRRLHAPQHASQAIGILMSRHEPDSLQIPAFPVYTRSGEVRVSVEHVPDADVRMSPRRGRLVRRFMRFVFAEVLRVRRRGMKLQSEGSTHNNYYIVPTIKITQEDGTQKIDIDWAFLELIYQHTEEKKVSDIEKPIVWQQTQEEEQKLEKEGNRRRRGKKKMANPLLKKNEVFTFDADKYREAVVTPWYRNQDQPQFFLVAEICWNLTPDSSFPSAAHQSFRDYYNTKYGVTLTQRDQPLLDVDHTSARLNLLTPRYVNRKGVALPVSSERTRRAKRDRLDQKQILIPELCRVHPFAAPLWFATVALPCVLYRINALLIADEIRRAVAIDVGLGIPKINEKTMPGFQWPALDFGWSLAEVLNADSEKNEKKKEEEELKREQKEKELREKEECENEENEEQKNLEEDNTNGEAHKTINDILQEKEDAEAAAAFEIGTWSNDMASSIPETSEYDDLLEPLPPNLTFCTSASGGTNWCDPIAKPKFSQYNPSKNFSMADSDDSYMSSDLDSDDTDLDFDGTDDDEDINGFSSSKNTNASMGVRIEYKTAHEAEAFDLERIKKVNPAPMPDEQDDLNDRAEHDRLIRQGCAPQEYIDKFRASVQRHKQEIIEKGHLITQEEYITEVLPDNKDNYDKTTKNNRKQHEAIAELFPFGAEELVIRNGQIDVASIEKNKRLILERIKKDLCNDVKKLNCFSMKDINIDSPDYVNEKVINVGFDAKERYEEMCKRDRAFEPYYVEGKSGKEFDFDYQPVLEGHPGPSPSVILQALTMSNANDGINLERLETIGDSFLKFAITAYLYCAHPTVHEGKLSHMRSKQVSNLNLYRLGRNKRLGARMIASKFEPHDNWLPPCHKPPPTLHPRINGEGQDIMQHLETPLDSAGCFIPYNLITQHSIPDKSIADCVEALIGAYLLECGPRGALLFMSWLGIRVLPCHRVPLARAHLLAQKTSTPSSPKRTRSTSESSSCSSDDESPHHQQEVFPETDWSWPGRAVGSLQPYKDPQGRWIQPIFGELKAPPSPLLRYIEDPEGELEQMLSGYDALERTLQYRFNDRSLLLQALTHASHHSNRLTDCYQRLEFLGDAILDYLITRHLYEDPRRHSPGALTDLRSALVNNTIFATLAARHGFHKYFRHMSPGLNEVLTKYVKIQEENGHSISEEHYLIQEDEMEQAEDVEVPKALGDLFESVAGAIFLDSGMSLGAVWKSYVNLMGAELEAFSAAAPKSPVRELLEAEPDTAKFGKPERLADGRRVRVCVEVFGRGTFKGVGRNYRIAKGTAARCALRHLRGHRAT